MPYVIYIQNGELIILFTGSIILINGVTSRSNKVSYYVAISGTFIGLITKLILIFALYENMNYESIFIQFEYIIIFPAHT